MKKILYSTIAAVFVISSLGCTNNHKTNSSGVRISKGKNPTLINAAGKPFVAKGIVYYQPQASHHYFFEMLDLKRVPKDLEIFRKAGFNTISITISWGELFKEVDPKNKYKPTKFYDKRIAKIKKFLKIVQDEGFYIYVQPGNEIVPQQVPANEYPAKKDETGRLHPAFKGYLVHNWLVDNEVSEGFKYFLKFMAGLLEPFDNIVVYALPYELMNFQWPWCHVDKKLEARWQEWLNDKNPDINYWKNRWQETTDWKSIKDIPLPIHDWEIWRGYLEAKKIKAVDPYKLVWRDFWEFNAIGIFKEGKYGMSFDDVCKAIRKGDPDALILYKPFVPKRMSWELGCLQEWLNKKTPPDAQKILKAIYAPPGIDIIACQGYPIATTNPINRKAEISFAKKVNEVKWLRRESHLPVYCQEFGINHHEWSLEECAEFLANGITEYKNLGILGYNIWQSHDYYGGGMWGKVQPAFGIYDTNGIPHPAVKAIMPLLK